jgi:hypothetical protein
VISATNQTPLWKDSKRLRYTSKQLLKSFKKTEELKFDLLVENHIELVDVFSQNSQLPFNLTNEKVDVYKF